MEGYLGLFTSAFLAATMLPVVSEAVLVGLQASGHYDPVQLWLWATAGNTLGSVVNWVLGRFLVHWRHKRWFPIDEKHLERATRWYQRWGVWSLLLAWTPIIGDPLTCVAGVLRCRFPVFLALVTISKGGRYLVLMLATAELLPFW